MFDISHGWLRYRPFRDRYELPSVYTRLADEHHDRGESFTGDFVDKRSGKLTRTAELGFLHWPGQDHYRANQAKIPATIVRGWFADDLIWQHEREQEGDDQSHYALTEIIEKGWLPDPVPETIAYHLAVNYRAFGFDRVPYDVAALPAARVQQVIEARFAFDKQSYPALQYLKWVAEGHRDHPLLRTFDTNIRETLMGLNHEAVHLFFYLASDYLYSPELKWWDHENKRLWRPMAVYLHWVGRTGQGLYDSFAGFQGTDWRTKQAREAAQNAPDLWKKLQEWDLWKMRNYQHEDGDPCQGETEGPSIGE